MHATMSTPTVRDFMTATPATVAPSATMAEAAQLMNTRHIRHLPVVDAGGQVVGLLSERDVALLEGLEGLDPAAMVVAVAMAKRPYTAAPETSLADVATAMAEHKYGSCIVVEGGKVVGVFTTVDACRALAAAHGG